ncbi:MAG: response regulator [Methyloligellaceae bacterium]
MTQSLVILMVDDDDEDIYSVQRSLRDVERIGAFRAVHDGDELFEYLENRGRYAAAEDSPRPDVILLDINLPRISGIDLLARLRCDRRFRDLTVVVLTTSSADADRRASYDEGADRFLTKPLSREDTCAIIRMCGG